MPDDKPGALPEFVKRTDLIHARIALIGDDYADVIALPLGELAELQKLDLAGADLDAVTATLDRILTRAVESWDLKGIASAYGMEPPAPPRSLEPPTREKVWAALPLSVLMRMVAGITAHSGN